MDRATTFAMIHSKVCVLVVTLSTQDNTTPQQQLKSGFKRTINWNKYQSTVLTRAQNCLIDPSFHEMN